MSLVQWEERGPVGIVTLERPQRKNSLTFESYAQLHELFLRISANRGIRALVVTGAGGDFSSGADVEEIIGELQTRDTPGVLEFARMTGRLTLAIRSCPQPVIAAVDGVCAGAGAAIAMACDMRIGTPRTKTAFLFTRIGLSGCDMGACALLPRILGTGRASELLMTGRVLDSEEASRWGWFNRLTSPESLLTDAVALATELAAGPSFALAMTKRQIDAEWNLPLASALEAEAQAQAICSQSEDFRRGYAAFSRKEKPVFVGN